MGSELRPQLGKRRSRQVMSAAALVGSAWRRSVWDGVTQGDVTGRRGRNKGCWTWRLFQGAQPEVHKPSTVFQQPFLHACRFTFMPQTWWSPLVRTVCLGSHSFLAGLSSGAQSCTASTTKILHLSRFAWLQVSQHNTWCRVCPSAPRRQEISRAAPVPAGQTTGLDREMNNTCNHSSLQTAEQKHPVCHMTWCANPVSSLPPCLPPQGKKVLVVGFGNSAGEIALDLSEKGAHPTVLIRCDKVRTCIHQQGSCKGWKSSQQGCSRWP